jgi:hypothetical protein
VTQTLHVFISYAHEDEAWCDLVHRQLKAVHDPLELEVWVDSQKIRIGDQWLPVIEDGLARADVAVLLISDRYFSSSFIARQEQPRLMRRRESGLLMVPILVDPIAWRQVAWLQQTEVRPRGGKALSVLGRPNDAKVKVVVAQIVEELATRLRQREPGVEAAPPEPDPHPLAQDLVQAVLLGDLDADHAAALARQLVAQVAQFSGLSGVPLLRAVRLFVEFHLLRSAEPTSPQALAQSLKLMPSDRRANKLLNELKRGAARGDYSQCEIEASSMFFMLAREREPMWRTYFEWLQRQPDADGAISTLATVNVLYGFIAPQFLVAGLMSHFEDDWRPVLKAYATEATDPGLPARRFESLQASQWNLWLVWGPSIPICRCEQWRGRHAFQYGYGDENNSLPLLEVDDDGGGTPLTLGPLAQSLRASGRAAALVNLSGRLRWGPQFLVGSQPEPGSQPEHFLRDDDPDDDDDPDMPRVGPGTAQVRLADAQAALFCASEPQQPQRDGLVLQLSRLQHTSGDTRAYFSAYLWLMFLVAGPAPAVVDDDTVGPPLLWRRAWPDWPESPSRRGAVRAARLWRNLLPIFVHANIADPAALHLQRRMLIASALGMLRQLWDDRAQCFDADDLARGLRFHLVCASDYTGCGEAPRYPTGESLAALLRHALAQEADLDFAAAVCIPPEDETAAQRPWGLKGFFSACHLPEMVLDHFGHVRELFPERPRHA